MKLLALASSLLAVGLFGCNKEEAPSSSTPPASSTTGEAATTDTTSKEPAKMDEQKQEPHKLAGGEMKDGEDVAVMETSAGKVVLRFYPKKAPKTVENFEKLAKKGFYDGTKFHRTIEGFMIQGGDPNTKSGDPSTWGQGDPGYKLKAEFNDTKHRRGTLSMARAQDPDSAGSQFFVVVADKSPEGGPWDNLDYQYTAFGEVVSGMDVVDKIVKSPLSGPNGQVNPAQAVVIKSLKIEKWPVK